MKAIITDYDYTLSKKFMTVELLKALEEKGLLKKEYRKEYSKIKKNYSQGELSYNDLVKTNMELMSTCLKDVSYMEVIRILKDEFDVSGNIYEWATKIKDIFRDDWLFIVVSSTMDLCLEDVQENLKFDTYLASSYQVIGGKFTGEMSSRVESEDKARYVKSLRKSFEQIIVIGDAPGDFGMLDQADVAILFEPNEHTLKEVKNDKYIIANSENIIDILLPFQD